MEHLIKLWLTPNQLKEIKNALFTNEDEEKFIFNAIQNEIKNRNNPLKPKMDATIYNPELISNLEGITDLAFSINERINHILKIVEYEISKVSNKNN
ncbi:hypothetical protein [Phytobacter massiliensis]|uniref:hypothetical protein n=1 Tax=Phytobacter massiliensis TaxID=1485952 RepID=UPI0002FD9B08|nr:hypothetical protein [Phytobacter massiliensis]